MNPSIDATGRIRQRWIAIFFLFGLSGITWSSWITRTPEFAEASGSNTATMGLILLGLSAGSMTGILLSAPMTRWWGARRAVALSATSMLLGAFVLALAAAFAEGTIAFVGLALFGWGMGASEVGINTEGARLEVDSGKPLLSSLHGGFSVGTIVGAALGFLMAAIGVPVATHFVGVAVVLIPPTILAIRALPKRVVQRTSADHAAARRDPIDLRLILIGVAVLAMAMAEGSANDWLPLIMVDGYGLADEPAAFTYLIFATAMATGRFAGPFFIARWGRAPVFRVAVALAILGLLVVIFSPVTEVAVGAAFLWGLGASVGFPIAISAAADGAIDPDRRVGQIVTIGYIAFLVGPPILGFLGEAIGLRPAMLVVATLAGIAFVVAGAVGSPKKRAESRSSEAADGLR